MGRPIYGILQMGRPIYGILQMGRPIYGIPVPVPIKTLAELQYTSWWDGSGMKFKMGGMDPTCRHPKPRPTNPRDFLTHHYFRTEMESSKSPQILVQRCFQKLCPEPFLELERKGKL